MSDDVTAKLATLTAERDALAARAIELETALRPFIRHYSSWMDRLDEYGDSHPMSIFPAHTWGELRAARAALAGRSARAVLAGRSAPAAVNERDAEQGEKHTPGPWIDGGSLLGSARLITNQNGAQIACVYGVRPKRESAANTRLIAAAPDYHAIAKMIDRDAGQLDAHSKEPAIISYDAIMELRDAIAKAEGR